MCNFLSAIVFKNGDIICRPDVTDSHEDLIDFANIRDNQVHQDGFIRVEFLPPEHGTKDIFDTKNWILKVDQASTQEWFSFESTTSKLAARVERMFVLEDRPILLGGCWLLGKKAIVKKVQNARIFGMYGSSKVGGMYNSSTVDVMHGSSRVCGLYGSSRVDGMYNSSKVDEMFNSSQIGGMYDSSKVDEMCNSSQVGWMHDSSKVGVMYGSSRVDVMHDSSKVDEMCNSSQVGRMFDSSTILHDFRKKK